MPEYLKNMITRHCLCRVFRLFPSGLCLSCFSEILCLVFGCHLKAAPFNYKSIFTIWIPDGYCLYFFFSYFYSFWSFVYPFSLFLCSIVSLLSFLKFLIRFCPVLPFCDSYRNITNRICYFQELLLIHVTVGWMNGTTSVPKSVRRYLSDKES